MKYISYLSDEQLIKEVKYVIDKAVKKRKNALAEFNKNVIDPFNCLFEAFGFPSHEDWKTAEIARQTQKTIQNHVGTFHQKILGQVKGWADLGTGGVVDLVNDEKQIIAEIKNKYSTVTGGKLAEQYHSLNGLISPKHSKFKGYTAYFVNIIPAKKIRSDQTFTPSDKETGAKCPANEKIRIIDGASFYSLVTGKANALYELHQALPQVIEDVFTTYYPNENFNIPDKNLFLQYFQLAYV